MSERENVERGSPEEVPQRYPLPDDRWGRSHRFDIGGQTGYITYGLYPDGRLGEVFFKTAKTGSTLSGFLDAVAISVSIGLQYGIPLSVFIGKFRGMAFPPDGLTDNPEIRFARSLLDYAFKWLESHFPNGYVAGGHPSAGSLSRG